MFTWWQLILVLLLDAWLGDPPGWPHLVRWQGRVITRLEAWLRPGGDSPAKLRLAGGGLVLLVVGGSALAAWGGMALGRALWPPLGLLVGIGLAFQCLAAGQLNREARAAECPLAAGDLPLARRMLARIVGRDTAALAPEGVRRAVIETIAENLNDGVVAPLFYLALLGPAGAVAYKAVNTLDSMLGYRDERYRHFGTAAARLATWPASSPPGSPPCSWCWRPSCWAWTARAPGGAWSKTMPATRAPTPVGPKRPAPAPWECGWAAPTSMAGYRWTSPGSTPRAAILSPPTWPPPTASWGE